MKVPNVARRWLERASRNVRLTRRLPDRFGGTPLCVSPAAALGYYRNLSSGAWNELYAFATHCVRPTATVWDIGASMGVFAFSSAHVAGPSGRVIAVEADTWTAECLKRSARNLPSKSARVEVLCAAASEKLGLQSFQVAERGRSMSHLVTANGAGAALAGDILEQHPVVTVTLDWLAEQLGPPDTIKLDVEGAELMALRGATTVLARRPALLVEVYEANADEVTSLLHNHDYELFDFSSGWEKRRLTPRAVYNTLALART